MNVVLLICAALSVPPALIHPKDAHEWTLMPFQNGTVIPKTIDEFNVNAGLFKQQFCAVLTDGCQPDGTWFINYYEQPCAVEWLTWFYPNQCEESYCGAGIFVEAINLEPACVLQVETYCNFASFNDCSNLNASPYDAGDSFPDASGYAATSATVRCVCGYGQTTYLYYRVWISEGWMPGMPLESTGCGSCYSDGCANPLEAGILFCEHCEAGPN